MREFGSFCLLICIYIAAHSLSLSLSLYMHCISYARFPFAFVSFIQRALIFLRRWWGFCIVDFTVWSLYMCMCVCAYASSDDRRPFVLLLLLLFFLSDVFLRCVAAAACCCYFHFSVDYFICCLFPICCVAACNWPTPKLTSAKSAVKQEAKNYPHKQQSKRKKKL